MFDYFVLYIIHIVVHLLLISVHHFICFHCVWCFIVFLLCILSLVTGIIQKRELIHQFWSCNLDFPVYNILGHCFNHDCVVWPMFDDLCYVCILMVYCVCFILLIYYVDLHQHCISLHVMLLIWFIHSSHFFDPRLCILHISHLII